MRYIAKAAVQKAISFLPNSGGFNYFLQRYVSRRLPASDSRLRPRVSIALRQYTTMVEHFGDRDPASLNVFEFGAGWDLLSPLVLWAAGLRRQTEIDIRRNVRLDLVNHALLRVGACRSHIAHVSGRPMHADMSPLRSLGELHDRFGITYLAPRDTRATGLAAGTFDYLHNAATIQHVPLAQLGAVLGECHRLLRRGGIFCTAAGFADNYSLADPGVSAYNQFRFSDAVWNNFFNSNLHYQSRIVCREYVEMVRSAGFEILVNEQLQPTEEEIEQVRRLSLAERFRKYPPEELAVKAIWLVCRKPV